MAPSLGGHTLAVWGRGVDVVYPREHKALMTDIAATGATSASSHSGHRRKRSSSAAKPHHQRSVEGGRRD